MKLEIKFSIELFGRNKKSDGDTMQAVRAMDKKLKKSDAAAEQIVEEIKSNLSPTSKIDEEKDKWS